MSKLASQGYHWLPLKEAWESLPEIDTAEFNELCPGYEGVWCRYLWTATYFQQFFKDVVIVTHGPLSCVAAVKNFKQTHYSLHSALPFAHSGFGRFFGKRLMGKNSDPKLTRPS